MDKFYIIVLSIITTEALTELLTKSDIFFNIREFFNIRASKHRVFEFFSDLLFCGYCTSVWVAFFMSSLLFLFTDIKIVYPFIDWFIIGLTLHRCSNILHYIIDYLNTVKVK